MNTNLVSFHCIIRILSTKVVKMPKDMSKHIAQMRDQSSKKNQKSAKYPPSEVYLCILGNGSVSSPRSLYLFTDRKRYLFNCGEGTQRLAGEHKMRMGKLNNVFITHKSWRNMGGLPGMALTLHGIGIHDLHLHGPPEMGKLLESAESFAPMALLDISQNSLEKEKFADSNMEFHYIPILKPDTLSTKGEDAKSGKERSSPPSPKVRKRSSSTEDTDDDPSPDMIMAFACKGHNKKGHLLFEKCIEFGVPPGPLLGDLKNGQDVTLPSGKVVRSQDVVTAEEECPLFLVVECPSLEYLDAFVKNEKLKQYQTHNTESLKITSLIVHFTPPKILKTAQYQGWIKKFPSSTQHLVLNSDCPTLNSSGIHKAQHMLNLLEPEIFPLLHESEVTDSQKQAAHSQLDKHHPEPNNMIYPHTLERFYLRPNKGHDSGFALKVDPADFIEEAMSTEEFSDKLNALHQKIASKSNNNNDDSYPEVFFLGTGSSIPNKVRNVSGILVRTSKDKCILLDSGEGTSDQMLRLFGDECTNMLHNLSCIFISHMHADHHMGLIQVLKRRKKTFKHSHKKYKPVILIGPKKLQGWLENCHKVFGNISPLYIFKACSVIADRSLDDTYDEWSIFEESADEVFISTVPVNHCSDAHGVVLKSKSKNWKLVYSGDTTPCEKLVVAGKNCSVLIHEATMEDSLAEDAAVKKHSTTSEAINIGKRMNADYTILTHFSQRYAKIPLFNEHFNKHIGCAFDNMKVQPRHLHILPLLVPALKCLFAEDMEELQMFSDEREQINKVLSNKMKTIKAKV